MKIFALIIFLSHSIAYGQEEFFTKRALQLCDTLNTILAENGAISDEHCKYVMRWSREFNSEEWDSVYAAAVKNYDISEYNFILAYRHILLQECREYRDIDDRIFHHSPNSIVDRENYRAILKFVFMLEEQQIDTTFVTQLFGGDSLIQIASTLELLDSIFTSAKKQTTINVYAGRLNKGTGVSVDLRNYKTRKTELTAEFYFESNTFEPTIKDYVIRDAKQIEAFDEERKKTMNLDGIPPPPPELNKE